MRRFSRIRRCMCGARNALIASSAMLLAAPPTGLAAPATSAHWATFVQAAPTDFHPGDGNDFYEVIAVNDGGSVTTETATIVDTLPAGVVVNAEKGIVGPLVNGAQDGLCEQATNGSQVTVTCSVNAGVPGQAAGSTYEPESGVVNVNINVHVLPTASGSLLNSASISGGGTPEAASASTSTPVTPESEAVPFGVSVANDVTNTEGLDTQAGSHPFAFTTLLAFSVGGVNPFEHCYRNTTLSCPTLNTQAKDVEVSLPPGVVGNPTAVPYCTQAQFETKAVDGCPPATQVGGLRLYFYGEGTHPQYAPVYNIEPPPGQPGELGFTVGGPAHIPMYFHVRSDGDYGLTADIANINQFDPPWMGLLTIWGNPADAAHHNERVSEIGNCNISDEGCESDVVAPKPFLRMPTSCAEGMLSLPVAADSWQVQLDPRPTLASGRIAGMKGCELLQFSPNISFQPSTHQAGSPVGYDINLEVPQNEELEGLGTPDVRDVEVTLPAGTVLSPSAANGLAACGEKQFGLKVRAKGTCPSASKVGAVEITTPLLSQPVKGNVYVGEPECSPCDPTQAGAGGMVRVLVEAEGSGVIIKLAGHTRIDQATGQLTTVFRDNPQLPFNDLVLSLERGSGAPLVNPTACGPAITTAAVTPWSSISADQISTPAVQIEGCAAPGFSPSFTAGMTGSPRAGAFSSFAVSLSRQDGEQALGRVSVTTPPGLLGVLKSVEQCSEALANAGTCSAGSQIGTGTIVVGPGSSPLTITGAKVFLTGPYEGRPFGLSISAPAVAGPFVLSGNAGNGNEVVRASIAIDSHTSALTVTSDPLPQALNGVPLDIRRVDVTVDREGFMFSPTNCDAMAVTGSIASTTGTVSNVSHPFQSTNCALLPFRPKFSASTQGKASKANGASLQVRVVAGAGQANIAKVKVDLPLQLPSRLSTLQKACVDSVFEANPASCSAASVVGHATVVTPLLKNPLIGPAYLVSHAGAAFPDLEIILQGEGITLILDGNTHISKGITSSIFKAVPDAPIKSFDLRLPEGPHSVLATNLSAKAKHSLCGQKLNMPTAITGQNGAVIKQTTKITATGCPAHKVAKKKAKKTG